MQKIIIGREYPAAATELVKNAKNEIKILVFDWRWYDGQPGARIQKFNNEILAAKRRGVAVRAVVNNNIICPFLKAQGIDVKRVNSNRTLHIKMILVDSKILLVGSHNFSMNAFELNHEMSVLLDEPVAVLKAEKFFENVCHL